MKKWAGLGAAPSPELALALSMLLRAQSFCEEPWFPTGPEMSGADQSSGSFRTGVPVRAQHLHLPCPLPLAAGRRVRRSGWHQLPPCRLSQAKWGEARKVEKTGKPSDFSLLHVGVAAPNSVTSRRAIYSQRPCHLLARLGEFSS